MVYAVPCSEKFKVLRYTRMYKCIEHTHAVHAISMKPAICMWQLQEGCAAHGRGKPHVKPCIKERNAVIAIVVTNVLEGVIEENENILLDEPDKKFEVVGEENR